MMTRGIAAVVVVLGLLVSLYVLTLPETPEIGTTPETAATVDVELESLRQRAEKGEADAQYSLGLRYSLGGTATRRDDAEGARWFRLAADQGHVAAQVNLGMAYRLGWGVLQDYTEAVKWFRLAADQGSAEAQHNLGLGYQFGAGVTQDDVEAHKWLNLAASRPTGNDQKQYAEIRDRLAERMTPAQLAEAQQRANEWQVAFDARQG